MRSQACYLNQDSIEIYFSSRANGGYYIYTDRIGYEYNSLSHINTNWSINIKKITSTFS